MKKISIITLLGSLLFLMPCIVLAEVENIDVDKIMSLDPHPTIGQVDWACECNFIFKECGTSETRGDYGCTPSSMGTVNMTTYFTSDWDFITWKERIDEGYGRETVVDKQVYLKSDNPDPLERCKLLLISTTYDEALGRPSSRE